MDGVALADAGWDVLNVSKGSWRTVSRIHTPRDTVENLEGTALGRVAYFIDAPAGTVMVVEDRESAAVRTQEASRREHWVLADPAHLRRVDLTAGRILVDWPAELE